MERERARARESLLRRFCVSEREWEGGRESREEGREEREGRREGGRESVGVKAWERKGEREKGREGGRVGPADRHTDGGPEPRARPAHARMCGCDRAAAARAAPPSSLLLRRGHKP